MLVFPISASAKRTLVVVNVPEIKLVSHLLFADKLIIAGLAVPVLDPKASALKIATDVVKGDNEIGE